MHFLTRRHNKMHVHPEKMATSSYFGNMKFLISWYEGKKTYCLFTPLFTLNVVCQGPFLIHCEVKPLCVYTWHHLEVIICCVFLSSLSSLTSKNSIVPMLFLTGCFLPSGEKTNVEWGTKCGTKCTATQLTIVKHPFWRGFQSISFLLLYFDKKH